MELNHPATLVILLISFGITMFFWNKVKQGKIPALRDMPVINAINEAIDRATEMGKPVIFTPGLSSLEGADAYQTLAGLSILRYISRKAAAQDTRLIVGCSKATIVPVAEDIIQTACREVGKPEAAKLQEVDYLSDQQFAYAAAYIGRMHREKAASNIFTGTLWAESLIFAMAGHSAGCYQVGGTAVWTQMAYIVPVCDATLLGEELMAVGAYLSGEIQQLATIASHDVLRLIGIITLIASVILTCFGVPAKAILWGG